MRHHNYMESSVFLNLNTASQHTLALVMARKICVKNGQLKSNLLLSKS